LTAKQIWREFARACRGEAASPAVPIHSVLATMALLDAARESSRRGQTIEIDPERQTL
jgi:predicted dehydrogenase